MCDASAVVAGLHGYNGQPPLLLHITVPEEWLGGSRPVRVSARSVEIEENCEGLREMRDRRKPHNKLKGDVIKFTGQYAAD